MGVFRRLGDDARAGARRAWNRLRRQSGEPNHNLLALSDLHLGIDLRRESQHAAPPAIDAPLGSLLAHYTHHRENGRPWRLIIVGDMVDFIAITDVPAEGEATFPVSEMERQCGLAPEPEKACWKLSRVMRRHERVFLGLARFLRAGHEVVIIRGNHDADWCWPEVQTLLRSTLVSLAYPGPTSTGLSGRRKEAEKEAMGQRLRFEDWFHLEPGRVYAEHGHHYDEYSITEDLMRRPDGPQPLSEPVSTLALRYFSNRHPGLDPSEVDHWRMRDYVRWARRRGSFVRYFIDYLGMCLRVSAFTLKASTRTMLRSLRALVRLPRDVVVESGHLLHVRDLLRTVKADHEALAREVSALMKPPAARSFWAAARMLYFDRMMLALGLGLVAAGCVAVDGPALARVGVFALSLGVAGLVNAWLDRARLIESHPKLLAAAHRVSVLFAVPVVIMGHSHREVNQKVGDGAVYFNLGTWLGHRAEGLPHVVVTAQGPAFRRWKQGKSDASVEVA